MAFPTTVPVTVISVLIVFGGAVTAKNIALETNDVTDHFISTSINFLFDIFLNHYTKKITQDGKTRIPVGGFEEKFSTKILSMDIEGAFIVDDGWCSNISTVHRTGDADMDRINEDLVLSTHLGLSELKVEYDNYDISLLGAHQKGKINIDIGKNSLFLKLQVQVKPTCLITLTELKIEELVDFNVDITNLGLFENLTDEITSWVIDEVSKRYRSFIEKQLFPDLSKAVKDADLCHYLPI